MTWIISMFYLQVTTLRQYMDGEEDLLSQRQPDITAPTDIGSCRLEDIQVGQFFSLVCQVVGRCVIDPHRIVLLQVWDGTQPSFPVKVEDLTQRGCIDDLIVDEELLAEAADSLVEVQVFDNHAHKAVNIQPGAFVRLSNLHAAQYLSKASTEAYCAFQPVELDLHGGGVAYNRDIVVLDHDDPDVVRLKSRLPQPSAGSQAHRKQLQTTSHATSSNHSNQIAAGPASTLPPDGATSRDKPDQVVTVLTCHHHQPVTNVYHLKHHTVPYKFHVTCRVNRYTPQVQCAVDLLKLVCPHCNYICPVPSSGASKSGDPVLMTTDSSNINRYFCPHCPHTTEEKRVLDYVMMLQFLLSDDSGYFVAGLWKNEAEVFFHQTTAEDILTKPQSFEFVQSRLKSLCPKDLDPEAVEQTAPRCDLCVLSYSTNSRTCYQIFDTCVEWSDLALSSQSLS